MLQKQPKTHLGKTKTDLKKRARIIAKELASGASKSQACIRAGYATTYAIQNAGKILENPLIQQTFQKQLEQAGLTDEAIAAKINSLFNAKEVKFFTDKGVVTDQREVEALSIQADMVKFAAKLKGHVIDRSASVNVTVSPVDLSKWRAGDVMADNPQGIVDITPDSNHSTT